MAGGITVKIKGPLFDGAPAEVVRSALEEVTADVARQGESIIKSKAAKFNRSGRGGTGVAAASVTSRSRGTTAIVEGKSSKGEVWWPWLEGTSKRNESTRFRGYHAFRLATNIMRKSIRARAEKAVAAACEKLGGA
jgi:hypothetical protein